MYHRHPKEDAEVIYLPRPNNLTFEQREHWKEVAAYAGAEEERYHGMREDALRMLGMLGIERGLTEHE